jgi:hypothetical protein
MQHSQANSTLNPARLPDHVTEDCIDYGLGFKHRGSNSSTHQQITSIAAQPRPHSNNNNNHIDLYLGGSMPKRGKSRPQTANLLRHRKNNSRARIQSGRPSAMTRVNSTSVAGHSTNPRNILARKKERNTTLGEQSLAGFTAQLLSEALNDEN